MRRFAPVDQATINTGRLSEARTDDQGRRVYWALAYAYGQTDRHGTTIPVGGLRTAAAGSFPILAFHNKSAFPVAKPVEVDHSDPAGPWVGFVFADTAEGRKAEKLVADGFLRGVSVGFIPTAEPQLRDDGVLVFPENELVELSLVPCPSSRDALIDLSRSLELPETALDTFARDLGFEDEAEDRIAELFALVRKQQADIEVLLAASRAAQPADGTSAPAQPDPAARSMDDLAELGETDGVDPADGSGSGPSPCDCDCNACAACTGSSHRSTPDEQPPAAEPESAKAGATVPADRAVLDLLARLTR